MSGPDGTGLAPGKHGGVGQQPSLDARLASVAGGDIAAFEAVYRELGGSVLGLVRRVLKDVAQSEEVTQEVFVEVWQSAARYEPRLGSARAWVLTIAHRRAVDRVRAETAAARRDSDVGRRMWNAAAPDDPVEQVVDRMEYEKVRRCLSRLTDLQHECVRLTYYTGYTYKQVAERLDVPLTTVKGRLRDGLIRLRDCLAVTK